MSEENVNTFQYTSEKEETVRGNLLSLFEECPIPRSEILSNLGLFINRQTLTRMFFIKEIYEQIIDINGIIMEFGVRWGNNLALFESLRGIYEPYNYNRKIIGFDTFAGFSSTHKKDGGANIIKNGSYSTTKDYDLYLEKILDCHENESPVSHIKKYGLRKGDAMNTCSEYLQNNPETIIALAYFDFDLYAPTEKCLNDIKDFLTKGSVVVFDELCSHDFPGETVALREALGLSSYKVQRSKFSSCEAYLIIE